MIIIASELEFTRWVRKQATEGYGWMVYHTYDSRRSDAGFPDLVMVRGGRVIFAELKYDKGYADWDDRKPKRRGKISEAQQAWIDALSNVFGVECYVWKYPDSVDELLRILEP